MHLLTEMIQREMKPALGVTEPGAIAFATALARSYVKGEITRIKLNLSSGIYKNAFSCGIPNSDKTGFLYAGALGAAIAQPELELSLLEATTDADRKLAEQIVAENKIQAELAMISSDIFIEAIVETKEDVCSVIIRDKHTHVEEIKLNHDTILYNKISKKEEPEEETSDADHAQIHEYSLEDILDYAKTVEIDEIKFLNAAYTMNLELFELSLNSTRTTFTPSLFQMNGNQVISKDERSTAQLLCNGAIEGRVIGLEKPAMSIAGSGAHGIICTMPLYAVYKVNDLTEEELLRATALSYLLTLYIKEYSGRLSAFCGCGVASGTAMAAAMAYLKKASSEQVALVINNMVSGISGMICDGGNQGCTMKGIVAVDAAFRAVDFALQNISIKAQHGIAAETPEESLRRLGLIASPGMEATEKTIVEIMSEKL